MEACELKVSGVMGFLSEELHQAMPFQKLRIYFIHLFSMQGQYGGYPQQGPYQGYPSQPQYVQQPNRPSQSDGCMEGCLVGILSHCRSSVHLADLSSNLYIFSCKTLVASSCTLALINPVIAVFFFIQISKPIVRFTQ